MSIAFASDIFLPLGQAAADDLASWVDPAGRRLSDRIWLARQATRDQIDRILAAAVVEGKSPIETARAVQQYLSPSWSPKRDARGRIVANQPAHIWTFTPAGAGGGSYPARRLARTELTRVFGRATLDAARRNPFVEKVAWRLSGSHSHADVCNDNARGSPYAIDDVPRYPAHPQCKCVIYAISEQPTDELVARIRKERGLD